MRRVSLLVIGAVALTACAERPDPVEPSTARTVALAKGGGGNQSAMGHANIHFTPTTDRRFTFNAVRLPNDSVTGQFELHILQTGVMQGGEVFCMNIFTVGTQHVARIGVRGTKSTTGNEGMYGYFTVVDRGEGANDQPDAVSALYADTPARALFHCTGNSPVPVYPIESGNIQIHP